MKLQVTEINRTQTMKSAVYHDKEFGFFSLLKVILSIIFCWLISQSKTQWIKTATIYLAHTSVAWQLRLASVGRFPESWLNSYVVGYWPQATQLLRKRMLAGMAGEIWPHFSYRSSGQPGFVHMATGRLLRLKAEVSNAF